MRRAGLSASAELPVYIPCSTNALYENWDLVKLFVSKVLKRDSLPLATLCFGYVHVSWQDLENVAS